MTVPPAPGSGDSAADPTSGVPVADAPGTATPAPAAYDGAYHQGHATGHEAAYPAPGDGYERHGSYDAYGSYDTSGTGDTSGTYAAYDPYDPGAGSEIAATSGFGFPVPRPAAAPAPVADFGYAAPHEPLAGPEFGAGAGRPAEPFLPHQPLPPSLLPPPPVPVPADHGAAHAVPPAGAAGIPSPAPEFATHDPSGFGAVPPPPVPAGPASPADSPFPPGDMPGGPVVSYTIKVNGTRQVVDRGWLGENLLQVLRERLGLPGAKDGCGQGVCGTCTVLVDGAPAVACLVPAATVGERAVTTIEGVSVRGGPAEAIQRALVEHGAVQCGFCVPGIVMSAHALLARLPGADEATIRRALAGHPCRCVGPNRMVAAVRAVAADQATEPAASLFEPADTPESHT